MVEARVLAPPATREILFWLVVDRQGGRPKRLSEDKRRMAQALRDAPGQNVISICKALGITRTTLYRYTQGKSHQSKDAEPARKAEPSHTK